MYKNNKEIDSLSASRLDSLQGYSARDCDVDIAMYKTSLFFWVGVPRKSHGQVNQGTRPSKGHAHSPLASGERRDVYESIQHIVSNASAMCRLFLRTCGCTACASWHDLLGSSSFPAFQPLVFAT